MTFLTSIADKSTKANRPNQNSDLLTVAECSLTAWIRVVTIN